MGSSILSQEYKRSFELPSSRTHRSSYPKVCALATRFQNLTTKKTYHSLLEGDEPNPITEKLYTNQSGGKSEKNLPEREVGTKFPITVDDIDLYELIDFRKQTLRNMFAPFSSILEGNLRELKITEHRIDLVPGELRPFTAFPRCSMISEGIQRNVEYLLLEYIIEHSNSL